jgi:hypothetical protein
MRWYIFQIHFRNINFVFFSRETYLLFVVAVSLLQNIQNSEVQWTLFDKCIDEQFVSCKGEFIKELRNYLSKFTFLVEMYWSKSWMAKFL